MLHVLDPHSNFYDPKAYAQMREDQHGRYYGVGMTIQPQLIDGVMKILVLYPFEGTPSFKAGIKPGDMIAFGRRQVRPTAWIRPPSPRMLKGPRGTHVLVPMSREGQRQADDLRPGARRDSAALGRPRLPDPAPTLATCTSPTSRRRRRAKSATRSTSSGRMAR